MEKCKKIGTTAVENFDDPSFDENVVDLILKKSELFRMEYEGAELLDNLEFEIIL
jgi:hypothetical protein